MYDIIITMKTLDWILKNQIRYTEEMAKISLNKLLDLNREFILVNILRLSLEDGIEKNISEITNEPFIGFIDSHLGRKWNSGYLESILKSYPQIFLSLNDSYWTLNTNIEESFQKITEKLNPSKNKKPEVSGYSIFGKEILLNQTIGTVYTNFFINTNNITDNTLEEGWRKTTIKDSYYNKGLNSLTYIRNLNDEHIEVNNGKRLIIDGNKWEKLKETLDENNIDNLIFVGVHWAGDKIVFTTKVVDSQWRGNIKRNTRAITIKNDLLTVGYYADDGWIKTQDGDGDVFITSNIEHFYEYINTLQRTKIEGQELNRIIREVESGRHEPVNVNFAGHKVSIMNMKALWEFRDKEWRQGIIGRVGEIAAIVNISQKFSVPMEKIYYSAALKHGGNHDISWTNELGVEYFAEVKSTETNGTGAKTLSNHEKEFLDQNLKNSYFITCSEIPSELLKECWDIRNVKRLIKHIEKSKFYELIEITVIPWEDKVNDFTPYKWKEKKRVQKNDNSTEELLLGYN